MRTVSPRRAWSLLLFLPTLATNPAADTPGQGFELQGLPYPGRSATYTLATGDVLAFDGLNVDLYDADGLQLVHLATLDAFVFPSFLLYEEDHAFLVFGESSGGVVYRMNLTPSAPQPVATIPLNYAAVFEDGSHLLVSAATRGFGQGNQVLRLDLDTGVTTELCCVAGASGPIVLAADGSLVYGTVTDLWPPPAGSSSLLRWSAMQLTGSPVLDESDATVLASGLDGAASLTIDPVRGTLFLAENNFATGVNRIRRFGAGSNVVVLDGTAFQSISNLEFDGGDGLAEFLPHQPATGGTLRYNTTDFAVVFERNALRPLRPALALTGPGTIGPGSFDLELTQALPNGFAIVFYDLLSQVPASEYALNLSFPLVLGLSPGGARRVPGIIPQDALGSGSASYVNPGGLEGLFAVQALLFDSSAKLAGSSNVAKL